MRASVIGAEAFKISLPVHESGALRGDIGEVLVPALRLTSSGEDVVRNLALAANERALVIRVLSEGAPAGTYTIDLEELADFVAVVHAARAPASQNGRAEDGLTPGGASDL
jgi:hypothetical protein